MMHSQNESYVPVICPNCGEWIEEDYLITENDYECKNCTIQINKYSDFYLLCNTFEDDIFYSIKYREKLLKTKTSSLAHGWSPEILSIISGFVLGLVTNTSYDLLKEWLRTKRRKYRHNSHFDEKANEVILEFLIENIDKIKYIHLDKNEIKFDIESDLKKMKESKNKKK